MTTAKKIEIAAVFVLTLVVTSLRAVRMPNDFSKAHWLIDYRFGFVKRGLIGTIVALTTRSLQMHPTEQLIAALASIQFGLFCAVLLAVSLRTISKTTWSTAVILAVLAFLSSPFVVMSAHLVGYFDNIIIVLAVISIALLLRGKIWVAAALQALAILVHENALLICF